MENKIKIEGKRKRIKFNVIYEWWSFKLMYNAMSKHLMVLW
jgi:hypothetical protein